MALGVDTHAYTHARTRTHTHFICMKAILRNQMHAGLSVPGLITITQKTKCKVTTYTITI